MARGRCLVRWFRGSRCPHENLSGIYGDSINHCGGYRIRCQDCKELLDGPVSIVHARNGTARVAIMNERLTEQVKTMGERLALARQALIDTRYFTEPQIGDDIAPRVMELGQALNARKRGDAVATFAFLNELHEGNKYADWFAAEAAYWRAECARMRPELERLTRCRLEQLGDGTDRVAHPTSGESLVFDAVLEIRDTMWQTGRIELRHWCAQLDAALGIVEHPGTGHSGSC